MASRVRPQAGLRARCVGSCLRPSCLGPERCRILSEEERAIDYVDEYRYTNPAPGHTYAYLSRPVFELIAAERTRRPVRRVFELGCGNGAFASEVQKTGMDVCAVDVSISGIEQARAAYIGPRFEIGSAYEDLASRFGEFDIVISLEVVEHLYSPRKWAANISRLLVPGGLAIVSTPYHGYLKNLALAAAGRWDSHLNPLWDHGHIKFWSVPTITELLREAGLDCEAVRRVGRIPALAMSMVLSARNSVHR